MKKNKGKEVIKMFGFLVFLLLLGAWGIVAVAVGMMAKGTSHFINGNFNTASDEEKKAWEEDQAK